MGQDSEESFFLLKSEGKLYYKAGNKRDETARRKCRIILSSFYGKAKIRYLQNRNWVEDV